MKKLFFLLIIIIQCSSNKNDSLVGLGMSNYLDEEIVIELDRFIVDFELFLINKYPNISKNQQVKKFLEEYYKSLILEDKTHLEKLIYSFNYFEKNIITLKLKGFFNSNNSNNELDSNALYWRYKTFYKNKNFKIDSIIKKDSTDEVKYSLFATNYYYGIYNIALYKKDSITMKWVENKINTGATFTSIAYIRTLPNEYLYSTLCKSMIISEFILPSYQYKENKFILK